VGQYDLVQASLKTLGFVADYWRIAMRPGKPLMFGYLCNVPVLGMPGNPVAALVCALLFVRPALRTMQGLTPAVLPFERITLADTMPANDMREDYVRAQIEVGADGGVLVRPTLPAQFERSSPSMASNRPCGPMPADTRKIRRR
jgi:molybdopterin molybdotransferase